MEDIGGSTEARPAVGELLAGRYRLESRLGRGGMGTVWRASDERMRRPVALKEPVMPPGVDERTRDELCRRLEREAQAAGRLNHPNVVRVHDVEGVGGLPWLVMELIEGDDLESWFASGTVTVAEAAEIGRTIASALAAVHAAGVVHRDVKPANIMRTHAGQLVLTDFGVAQVEGSTDLTATGVVIGSMPYLSPERASGRRPTAAADLWALGLVLYEALEGVHPYRRASVHGTLLAIVEDPVPPPRRAGALAGPIMALLERDPERRPTAAQAVELFAAAPEPAVFTPTQATVPPAPPASTAVLPPPSDRVDSGPAPVAERTVPETALRSRVRRLAALLRRRRGLVAAVVVAVALVAAAVVAVALVAAGAAGWLLFGRDSAPPARGTLPSGYGSHSVGSLGLGIAVPNGWTESLGADEANWRSPDAGKQIRIKDEGKATKSAQEYAQDRLDAVKAGVGTFCNDKPVPEMFHVAVVHGPESVLHGGGVGASAIEYRYSTRAEDAYPCLDYKPADRAMEQYMVHGGRVLHLTVTFTLNYQEKQTSDPAPGNQQLYSAVSDSMAFG
ncbi:protein kinase [Kitasatospora sp. NPDC048365]|uniref:serine/threonine-protein kinase n=1 Tax=Kitasatospora sp. NPDC048365 TaxID=3364050 RepID=UPI003720E12F